MIINREASAIAVSSMAVDSVLIVAPIAFLGVYVWSVFCCSVLSVVSSFAIISLGKRELVALLYMSFDVKLL